MSTRSVRMTACLLFAGLFAFYLTLSPGTTAGRGYIGEELESGKRMLTVFNSWVKGRQVPPLLWTRHGPMPVLFDLPFIKVGKLLGLDPDTGLSFEPVFLTAALMTLAFLWLRKVCTPGLSLLLTLVGAFSTMVWPYAYIGLETKQSFFVLLAGYLALACGKIRGWPRLLSFAVVCGLAMTMKSIGVILFPVIGYLLYVQFRDDWRERYGQALVVVAVIGVIVTVGVVTRNFYWTPVGGGVRAITDWMAKSPFQVFTNVIGLFGSPTKGLFVFAPVLLMSVWAVPRILRSHRDTAVFATLVLACTVALLSILTTFADEVWGPRFLHISIAPLLVCIGAAWPRFQWRSHAPLLFLAAVGVVTSFLGAFYYYGARGWALDAARQNTMEWLTSDTVWNEVTFNARLFQVWLQGGGKPAPWTAEHIWVWTKPPDVQAWRTINLQDYCNPQSFLLLNWRSSLSGTNLALFRLYLFSGFLGFFTLAWVFLRTVKHSRAETADPVVRPSRRSAILAAGSCSVLMLGGLIWVTRPVFAQWLHRPTLKVSKTEVLAGSDFYVLSIEEMANLKVNIRYSLDGAPPETFSVELDSKGEKRFDVGASTRKGTYHMTAISQEGSPAWTDTDAVVTVK